jgi:hypothetical protein|mmetsp:Transcript_10314/g.30277  ORF Transcript_10314/g.30277 Transcript_10314/m.30277 type:complete len:267 (-) Transcript_10314:17-817(-)
MSSLAEKEEQPSKPDDEEEQPAKKRARTDAAPVTDPEASDDAAPAPAPASGFAAHTSGGFGSFGGSSSGGFGSSSGGGFGGFSGGGFGGFGAAASEEKTGFAAAASDGKTEEKGGFGFGASKADDKPAFEAGGFGSTAEAPAPAAPEKIDASNGEEGDTELHKCRCKAFVLEKPKEGSATWKERGVCVLKVLRDKKGALRVVARRDLTHTLVLNAAPSAVDAHGDKAVRFMAATSEKSADTFLVRVKTKDDRASLLAVLAPEKASA